MKSRSKKDNEQLGTKINKLRPETRSVLYALNGADDYVDGGYDSFLGRRIRIYWRDRAISRTESGKHYRMVSHLAELLMAETVEPVGVHPTNPPTVLVTADETLAKLEQHVVQSEVGPKEIVMAIRRQLGIPEGPPQWDDLMYGSIK